ncbi:MAG: hypothetical protein ACU837_05890 [Gammaproteobacteria bacterium]
MIPAQLAEDKKARRNPRHAFFAQFQADAALLRCERAELHERQAISGFQAEME